MNSHREWLNNHNQWLDNYSQWLDNYNQWLYNHRCLDNPHQWLNNHNQWLDNHNQRLDNHNQWLDNHNQWFDNHNHWLNNQACGFTKGAYRRAGSQGSWMLGCLAGVKVAFGTIRMTARQWVEGVESAGAHVNDWVSRRYFYLVPVLFASTLPLSGGLSLGDGYVGCRYMMMLIRWHTVKYVQLLISIRNTSVCMG